MKIPLEKEIENSIKRKKDEIVQEKLQGELASQLQNLFQNVMEEEDITKEMHSIVRTSPHTGTPTALPWPCQVLAQVLWVVPSLPTTLTSRSCISYQLVFCLSHPPRNLPVQSCVPETPAGLPVLFSAGVRTEGQAGSGPCGKGPRGTQLHLVRTSLSLALLVSPHAWFARNWRRTAEGLAGSY